MHTYELLCEQTLPLPLVSTFEFFKDPANLSRITPPWLNFEIRSRKLEMEQRKRSSLQWILFSGF